MDNNVYYIFIDNDDKQKKLLVWDIFIKLIKSKNWITWIMKSWIKMFIPRERILESRWIDN